MTTQTVLRQMPELENALKQRAPGLCLEAGALMARYTTLHLGGPADLLATPGSPRNCSCCWRKPAAWRCP